MAQQKSLVKDNKYFIINKLNSELTATGTFNSKFNGPASILTDAFERSSLAFFTYVASNRPQDAPNVNFHEAVTLEAGEGEYLVGYKDIKSLYRIVLNIYKDSIIQFSDEDTYLMAMAILDQYVSSYFETRPQFYFTLKIFLGAICLGPKYVPDNGISAVLYNLFWTGTLANLKQYETYYKMVHEPMDHSDLELIFRARMQSFLNNETILHNTTGTYFKMYENHITNTITSLYAVEPPF